MSRILVTNDDGISSPGLHALARAALDARHEVTIAAPARQSSGSSASIVADQEDGRIMIERRTLEGLEEIRAFAVHGGPGLIALVAAHGAFGPAAEAVLSGVNHGANVGRAILHSGTVGAALTAGVNGARGMAVSLDVGFEPGPYPWERAARTAIDLLPLLMSRPGGAVFNLNVPLAEAHGIRQAPLAPFGIVQTTLQESGESHVRLTVEETQTKAEPGSDAALLTEGWITLTALDAVSHVALGVADDELRAVAGA
jgi:5'-nucleotidase